jgi:formylglycine-generating enzyme required for sulfatase activity
MLVQARKAWQAFQQQYPNFTDDTANLRERLRPDPERSTPAKRFGGMMELIETIIPVRDQTTILRYNTEIPILEFCPIPSGYTRIGENWYWVEAFEIGKYPVTNAQFNAFIKAADGYSNPEWWNFSVEGRDWRRYHTPPQPSEFSGDKHPREMVCWYEAVAFTRWLSHRTGLPLSLPTEAQWQFAAQGEDNRLYPWGNTYDPSRCNTYESNILRTTPVDYYPSGVSRFGVFDMAGNVLEWCLNPYDNPALASLEGNYPRALRGGNWGYHASWARTTVRYSDGPMNLYSGVGFRVILRNSAK